MKINLISGKITNNHFLKSNFKGVNDPDWSKSTERPYNDSYNGYLERIIRNSNGQILEKGNFRLGFGAPRCEDYYIKNEYYDNGALKVEKKYSPKMSYKDGELPYDTSHYITKEFNQDGSLYRELKYDGENVQEVLYGSNYPKPGSLSYIIRDPQDKSDTIALSYKKSSNTNNKVLEKAFLENLIQAIKKRCITPAELELKKAEFIKRFR